MPTNTTMGKLNELRIDPKKWIIHLNKSGKSLGAIKKQLQVPRATVQTIVCTYNVLSQPQWGRKCRLLPAAEIKISQNGEESTKSHQKADLPRFRSWWIIGFRDHSQVWEAAVQAGSPCSKSGTERLDWRLLLIAWTQRTPGGKFCGHTKQKSSSLTSMPSNMFGGEKVRPLTPRTPWLSSSTVVVGLCCRPVLLMLYRENGIMKEEDYLQIHQDVLKSSAQRLGLGGSWVFQQDNDPKRISKVVMKWLNKARMKVFEWPFPKSWLDPHRELGKNAEDREQTNGTALHQEEWSKYQPEAFGWLPKGHNWSENGQRTWIEH